MMWDPMTPAVFGKPNVAPTAAFMERVEAVMSSGWLTNNGPQVRELEANIADFLSVKHVVLVTNATIGLQIALRALVSAGEVIMPSFTFAATSQAATWCGYTPKFVDIDPSSQQLDISKIEAAITPQTRAILPVHMWGEACDVRAIQEIANKHGLKVIYDAAHAFGSTYGDIPIGGFGDAEVFSFHATKCFNTVEGGAITTNCDETAERLRQVRAFGMTPCGVDAIGTNGKMSELHAAHGLSLLPELPAIIRWNNHILDVIEASFSGIDGLRIVPTRYRGKTNGQYAILQLTRHADHRDALIESLKRRGIHCRPYFTPPCHLHTGCKDAGHLPHTEFAAASTIAIPSGMQLSAM
jgi:dTDP-4-amino-4,6-dideoxygalactose transaminase